jgi:hypothetical protein
MDVSRTLVEAATAPDPVVAFFTEEVDPTVREFLADLGSLRRGRLATLMLVHMADHFWHGRPERRSRATNTASFRALLGRQQEAFWILCEAAAASRHAMMRRSPPGSLDRPVGGTRPSSLPVIVVGWRQDQVRALDAEVRRVHAMWAALLELRLAPL